MKQMLLILSLLMPAIGAHAANEVHEDYVLLTAHIDSSMIRKRTPQGHVLEFVDVLGRKNRCSYTENGRVRNIRYSTESGDFMLRFVYNKREELTSMVLADRTIVLFRNGVVLPSTGRHSLAESYAGALEHWLSKHNSGL